MSGGCAVSSSDTENSESLVAETDEPLAVRRNRMERMVLGSVSDHVTRNAPCPVLVVRS